MLVRTVAGLISLHRRVVPQVTLQPDVPGQSSGRCGYDPIPAPFATWRKTGTARLVDDTGRPKAWRQRAQHSNPDLYRSCRAPDLFRRRFPPTSKYGRPRHRCYCPRPWCGGSATAIEQRIASVSLLSIRPASRFPPAETLLCTRLPLARPGRPISWQLRCSPVSASDLNRRPRKRRYRMCAFRSALSRSQCPYYREPDLQTARRHGDRTEYGQRLWLPD